MTKQHFATDSFGGSSASHQPYKSGPRAPPRNDEDDDIAKAIAAGAKACSFGKMFLFSLAAGGQQGVEHLLQNMHDEINRNMVLMGCKNLKELNSSKLIYRK